MQQHFFEHKIEAINIFYFSCILLFKKLELLLWAVAHHDKVIMLFSIFYWKKKHFYTDTKWQF